MAVLGRCIDLYFSFFLFTHILVSFRGTPKAYVVSSDVLLVAMTESTLLAFCCVEKGNSVVKVLSIISTRMLVLAVF